MLGAVEWAAQQDATALSAAKTTLSEAEFSEFYQETARSLKAYLLRLTSNSALADDLLQESYFRMLRAELPILDAQQRKNYLFRVATNLARDQFRRKKFEGGPVEEEVPDAAPQPSGLKADLGQALDEIPPRDRELVWLAYVEGASHREIAGVTGLKEASVRPMLYKARQRLAQILRSRGFGAQSERTAV